MSESYSKSLEVLFSRMENFVSTKTVVGDAITIGNIMLLPLIEVSVGVGAGSSEKNDKPSGAYGGGGLGAKITPCAVISINNGTTQLISLKNNDAVSKLIDMAPGIMSKLNIGSFFNSDKASSDELKNQVNLEEETIVEE